MGLAARNDHEITGGKASCFGQATHTQPAGAAHHEMKMRDCTFEPDTPRSCERRAKVNTMAHSDAAEQVREKGLLPGLADNSFSTVGWPATKRHEDRGRPAF